jgi:hypothetical protein
MSNARKLADNLPSEGQLGNRNLLINSGFSISQRGDYTSATSVSNDTYYVDRWKVRLSGVSANIQHIKGSNASPNYPNIGSNTLKLTATSTASGILRHLQQVEGFLKGRELTFSAWVKSNSSDARLFQYQHGSSNRVASSAHTGGGGWEKLIVTATNNATSNNQLYFDAAIASSSFANVSIASGDYIEIAEPQLEFGSQSTPFEHELYDTTIRKCGRYYQRISADAGFDYGAVAPAIGSTAAWYVPLPLKYGDMRVDPTLSYSAVGDFRITLQHSSSSTCTSIGIGYNHTDRPMLSVQAGSNSAGSLRMFGFNGASSGWIAFDAEL